MMNQDTALEKRLLREITPRNLLSFGPQTPSISLNNLNILIGPNGSGKSNLIEIVSLLRAAATDLRAIIRRGGGIGEWVWKGNSGGVASLDVVINNPLGKQSLRHFLAFAQLNQTFHLEDERIENEKTYDNKPDPYFYYRYEEGQPILSLRNGQRRLERETITLDQSILSQRRDPETYPEVSYLASAYEKTRIYREWSFGRSAVFREPQKADMRNNVLEEDFTNLGLFLNRLRRIPKAKNKILNALRDLYEGLDDFDVSIEGGTVQVFFTEGEFTIPANRLSDGTLRYLCILAILCDPNPPPLICLEEPELGLHPDILPKVADLLIHAAEKTQLIVTTHSDILVDALTDQPETVLVCEKLNQQTIMRRLNSQKLTHWLKHYRLGELWLRGEIGGTRW
jgi:predicted ATPase